MARTSFIILFFSVLLGCSSAQFYGCYYHTQYSSNYQDSSVIFPEDAIVACQNENNLCFPYWDFGFQTLSDGTIVNHHDNWRRDLYTIPGGLRAHHVSGRFYGWLHVPENGMYQFYIKTDDGTRVFIGDREAVDVDRTWRLQAPSAHVGAPLELTAGMHPINVEYFERGGHNWLEVKWRRWSEGDKSEYVFLGSSTNTYNDWTCLGATGDMYVSPRQPGVNGVCWMGKRYYTLDHADPTLEDANGCQDGYIAVPAGAEIAPNDAASQLLLQEVSFGTSCVALADGSSVKTSPVVTETAVINEKYNAPIADSAFEKRDITAVEWSVALVSKTYANGATTYTYELTNLGGRGTKDLSHWVIGVAPSCEVTSAPGTESTEVGPDPTTGLPGVKWDHGQEKGTTATYTITVSGDMTASASTINYAVKGGTYYAIGEVEGPICGSSSGSTPIVATSINSDPVCQPSGAFTTNSNGEIGVQCSTRPHRVLVRDDCRTYDTDQSHWKPIHTSVLKGWRYATLNDGAHPNRLETSGCDSRFQTVPTGWEIAPYDDDSHLLLMFNGRLTFGTGCVIFADGTGRANNNGGDAGEVCAKNAIRQAILDTAAGTPLALYRVHDHACPARILLRQKADPSINGYSTENEISHKRTVLGYQYASVDSVWPHHKGNWCQHNPMKLPAGWEVAPGVDEAYVVPRSFYFGTNCLVYADGTARNREGKVCDPEFEGKWLSSYTAKDSTYVNVRRCNARVLIRRKETVEPASFNELCSVCTSWGDPHITSFDRSKFNSYGQEMVILASGPNPDFDICADNNEPSYMCNWQVYAHQIPLRKVATNKAVLISYETSNGSIEKFVVDVVADAPRDTLPTIALNGQALSVTEKLTTSGGAVVEKRGNKSYGNRKERITYTITLPNKIRVVIIGGHFRQHLLDYKIHLPKRFSGTQKVIGLCGDCNSDSSNDYFNHKTGVILPKNQANKISIQNDFVAKMRVEAHNPFDITGNDNIPLPPAPAPVTETDVDACAAYDTPAKLSKINDAVDRCCMRYEAGSEKYTECRDEVCINKGCTTIEENMKDLDEEDDALVGGRVGAPEVTCAPVANVPEVIAPIEYGGRTYATLDGVQDAAKTGFGYQSGFLAVPAGWKIADADEVNLAFISCYPFQTQCMVFADGTTISTDGKFSSCGTDGLTIAGTDNECFSPKNNHRILLVKDIETVWKNALGVGEALNGYKGWYSEAKDGGAVSAATAIDDSEARAKALLTVQGGSSSASIFKTIDVDSIVTGWSPSVSLKMWSRVDPRCAAGDNSKCLSGPNPRLQGGQAVRGTYLDIFIRHKDHADDTECDLTDTCKLATVVGSSFSWHAKTKAMGTSKAGWEMNDVGLIFSRIYASAGIPSNEWSNWHVKQIRIHIVLRGGLSGSVEVGTPFFDMVGATHFNYLNNADFNEAIGDIEIDDAYAMWVQSKGKPELNAGVNRRGLGEDMEGESGSLHLKGEYGSSAVSQMVRFPNGAPNHIMVCTWARGDNIPGVEGEANSIWVDFMCDSDHADDCHSYKNIVATKVGTAGWHRRCKTLATRGLSTQRMGVTARMELPSPSANTHSFFDGVFASPTCNSPLSLKAAAVVYGDPHYVTGDGLKLDIQTVGEYSLYNDNFVTMQIRHERAGLGSVNTAIAVKHFESNTVIQVDRAADWSLEAPVRVNGKLLSINNEKYAHEHNSNAEVLVSVEHSGALEHKVGQASDTATHSAIRYSIRMISNHEETLDKNGDVVPAGQVVHAIDVVIENTIYETSYINFFFAPPQSAGNTIAGLLGDFDGDVSNDLTTAAGEVLTIPADMFTSEGDAVAKKFAESWRIKSHGQSIFTYKANESMNTFYDPNFNSLDMNTVSAEQIASARTTCLAAGVPMEETENCVYDVLSAGEGYAVASFITADFGSGSEPIFDDNERSAESDFVTVGGDSGAQAGFWVLIATLLPAGFGLALAVTCCVASFGVCGWRIYKAHRAVKDKDEKKIFAKFDGTDAPDKLTMAEEGLSAYRTVSNLVTTAARHLSNLVSQEPEYTAVENDRDLAQASPEASGDEFEVVDSANVKLEMTKPEKDRSITHDGAISSSSDIYEKPKLRVRPTSMPTTAENQD